MPWDPQTKGATVFVREDESKRVFGAAMDGACVEVVGDPWSGRTSVLLRARDIFAEAGLEVLVVRGVGDLMPLEAMRYSVSVIESERGKRPPPSPQSGALSALLSRIQDARPAAVLIDDADRLDLASWQVVEATRKALGVSVVAVSGSSTPITQRPLLRFAHPLERVDLAPLTLDGIHDLLEGTVKGPVSPVLSARIHSKSGGNVGLAAAVAGSALNAGRIRETGGVWTGSDDLWSDDLDVVYEAYLSRHDDDVVEALSELALLGVGELASFSETVGAEMLARLEVAGLLRSFSAADRTLISLDPPGLVDYFLRRRTRLVPDQPDAGRRAADLGEEVVDLALVGRVFADSYKLQLAAASSEWELDRSVGAANRVLNLQLSGARDAEVVTRVLTETELAGAAPRDELTFRYLRARWDRTTAADSEWHETARIDTDDLAPDFPYSSALEALGIATSFETERIAEAPLARLRELAASSDLNGEIASIVLAYGLALSGSGAEALAVLGRAPSDASTLLRDQHDVAYGLALYSCGRLEEAARWASERVARCISEADRIPLVAHSYIAVLAHAALGRFDEAVQASQTVITARVDGSALLFATDHALLHLLAFVALRTGRLTASIGLRERAAALVGRSEALPFGTVDFIEAAEVSATGDGATAATLYRAAAARLAERNYRLAAATLTMLSLIAHYDPESAAEFRHEAEAIGGPLYGAFLDARAAELAGNPDALVAAAQTLRTHGADDEAARFLTAAVKLYRAHGQAQQADSTHDLVHEILTQLPLQTTVAPAERIGLTTRESELIALVAEGLSNVAISERLNVSVRTVEAHLRNIRKKTGTVSRSDLARLGGRGSQR